MELVSTGIAGLDSILGGGLPRGRLHLVEGPPGVGKTTLGLEFALVGLRDGERCLYVTFGETKKELEDVAASHGWSLGGLDIHDHPAELEATLADPQTVFHPAEVELSDAARILKEGVERVRPHRAVIDGLSELRLLAGDALDGRGRQLGNADAGSDDGDAAGIALGVIGSTRMPPRPATPAT